MKSLIQSPLNYTGGKFKLLRQILPELPENIKLFVDLFCGGCNVGINVRAEKIIFNDINKPIGELYNVFKRKNKEDIFRDIDGIITEFSLSETHKYGYEYYLSDSGRGLQNYNKKGFIRLRDSFNTYRGKDDYFYLMLYVLIVYAFNNQVRFNAQGAFNLPVGKRDFNTKMQGKLSDFIDRIKYYGENYVFLSHDFREIDISSAQEESFVYADPPYLISCAAYNEQRGWSMNDERALLRYLEALNVMGIKFALSNILAANGKVNTILAEWIEKNQFHVVHLRHSYGNSNYQKKDKISEAQEILVLNY